MARDFTLSIYGNETLKAEFEKIKQREIERNPGIPISDSHVGATIIKKEYEKILGKETNQDRITTIATDMTEFREAIVSLKEEIRELRVIIIELLENGNKQADKISKLEDSVRELTEFIGRDHGDDDQPYISEYD